MLGLRHDVECAHQTKEWLEEQVQTISAREEKAQGALQVSKEDAAKLSGELSMARKRVGELERNLLALRKMLRSRTRMDTPASTDTEAVSSGTLAVSVAQMTIGVASPMPAMTMTRQSAALPFPTTAVSARQPIAAPVGTADTATTVARSMVQMATGSPYLAHPPPPGFPYLTTGYPPYWGMYPYPYPQYLPPMLTMPLGGNPTSMNATLPTSATVSCHTQVAMETPAVILGTTLDSPLPISEAPDSPASSYGEMPPLEGLEDSDELEEEEIETKGAVCAVTSIPKGEGHRRGRRQVTDQQGPESQQ